MQKSCTDKLGKNHNNDYKNVLAIQHQASEYVFQYAEFKKTLFFELNNSFFLYPILRYYDMTVLLHILTKLTNYFSIRGTVLTFAGIYENPSLSVVHDGNNVSGASGL